jgi:hypothetical protein
MTIQPRRQCSCGLMPIVERRKTPFATSVQVKCRCGRHGAAILYTKPKDEAWAVSCAVDGWDLDL